MQDVTLFLLNRGQAIDPTVGGLESAMAAIDSVLKTAATRRCGACHVSWTAPVSVCPECGDDSRVEITADQSPAPRKSWEENGSAGAAPSVPSAAARTGYAYFMVGYEDTPDFFIAHTREDVRAGFLQLIWGGSAQDADEVKTEIDGYMEWWDDHDEYWSIDKSHFSMRFEIGGVEAWRFPASLLPSVRSSAAEMPLAAWHALTSIASREPRQEDSIHGPRMRCPHCGWAWNITTKEPERHGEGCAYVIAARALSLSAAPAAQRTAEQDALDRICEASGYESWFIAGGLLMFERTHPTKEGMRQAIPVHKVTFAESAIGRKTE